MSKPILLDVNSNQTSPHTHKKTRRTLSRSKTLDDGDAMKGNSKENVLVLGDTNCKLLESRDDQQPEKETPKSPKQRLSPINRRGVRGGRQRKPMRKSKSADADTAKERFQLPPPHSPPHHHYHPQAVAPPQHFYPQGIPPHHFPQQYPNTAYVQSQALWEMSNKQKSRYLALDCEMVGVGQGGTYSALARVTLIDWHGAVVLDELVKQEYEVTDYRTFVSGITPELLAEARMDLKEARKMVLRFLKGKILVGHALKNDLQVLGIAHEWHQIRDTAHYGPYMKSYDGQNFLPRKLKELSNEVLNRDIQVPGRPHCPQEDALAALDLYKHCWRDWESMLEKQMIDHQMMQHRMKFSGGMNPGSPSMAQQQRRSTAPHKTAVPPPPPVPQQQYHAMAQQQQRRSTAPHAIAVPPPPAVPQQPYHGTRNYSPAQQPPPPIRQQYMKCANYKFWLSPEGQRMLAEMNQPALRQRYPAGSVSPGVPAPPRRSSLK